MRLRSLLWCVLFACGPSGSGKPEVTPPIAHACTWRDCAESAPTPSCVDYCASTTTTRMNPLDAGAVEATQADAAPSRPTLPPPKPTTLSLAKTGDPNADAELTAGDTAFERGDFPAAQKHYEAARTLAPKKVAVGVGLARVRIAKTGAPLDYGAAKGNAEIKAAVVDLKKLVAQEPDFGAAQAELGGALLMLADADQALIALRRAVELLPQEAEAHSMLGVALVATGHKDLAVPELQKASELDVGRGARHGNYGTVLLLVGRVADAVKELEIQAALADGDARAHSDLGTALLAQNDLVRATAELERAKQLDPTRASYRSNLGYAYQRANKMAEAIAEYRQAVQLDDKLADAWTNLGTALAHDPKTRAEARAAFEKARAIDPSDPNVKANLEELDALERESNKNATPKKTGP
jgi:Flp pilus assembly protein TadD